MNVLQIVRNTEPGKIENWRFSKNSFDADISYHAWPMFGYLSNLNHVIKFSGPRNFVHCLMRIFKRK